MYACHHQKQLGPFFLTCFFSSSLSFLKTQQCTILVISWKRLLCWVTLDSAALSRLQCSVLSHSVRCDWNPRDCSPPGSSAHGIPQARILESVPISFSRGSSWLRDWTRVSCIAGRFFTTAPQMQRPLLKPRLGLQVRSRQAHKRTKQSLFW